MAVAVPAASAGTKTECNGFFVNTTVNGGLVVNDGDNCFLFSSTVNGGFTVKGGFIFIENSTIHGGWSITGNTTTDAIYMCGNNVDGGLSVHGVTSGDIFSFGEENAGCAGGTVNGGVSFTNNNAFVELDSYAVNGGVTITGNTVAPELENSVIHGTATCQADTFNDLGEGANTYIGRNNGCPA